jgi:hypothetical protein
MVNVKLVKKFDNQTSDGLGAGFEGASYGIIDERDPFRTHPRRAADNGCPF